MRVYETHDNGGRPFRVVYDDSNKRVAILTLDIRKSEYTILVKEYKHVEKLWVGKSPLNPTSKYSGGYGKKFDGNSILIQLPNRKYVFVGDRVYEFQTVEPITKYYSTVGNSDVPYPVALSEHYIYFMLAPPKYYGSPLLPVLDRVRRNEFPPNIDWSDAYGYYYENRRNFKTLEQIRIRVIKKRIL